MMDRGCKTRAIHDVKIDLHMSGKCFIPYQKKLDSAIMRILEDYVSKQEQLGKDRK